MSLRSSLNRLAKGLRKVVKKAAPVAIPVALGFALGPAGAGVGARIAGGLKRAGSIVAKNAPKVLGALTEQGPTLPGSPPILPDQMWSQLAPIRARLLGPRKTTMALPAMNAVSTEQYGAMPQQAATPAYHQVQAMPPQLSGVSNMSLLGSLGKFVGRVATEGFGSYIGNALPQLPSSGNRIVTLPGAGTGGFRTGGQMTPYGAVVPPRGYHYAKDGSGRIVRNRRMNVCNPRAARRAIRRIKGLRKVLHSIERQLPTRTVRTRK